MANVTYYFGAGASAESLPTYSNFKERLSYFLKIIEGFMDSWGFYESAKLLRLEIKALIEEMEYHGTPDLVVKKYFHLGDKDKVYQVKNILNSFFIFEQTIDHYYHKEDIDRKHPISKRYDKRYDALIARILKPVKDSFELPPAFKIITWNYDFQFELSAYRYLKEEKYNALSGRLQSMPRVLSENGKFRDINLNLFAICHLNGIALLLKDRNDNHIKIIEILGKTYQYKNTANKNAQENLLAFKAIIDNHEKFRANSLDPNYEEELNSTIFFGWENLDKDLNPDKDFKIYKAALEIAQQTDILVICGYSFPDFNANIDKMILSQMGGLKKVYIQSLEGERIKNAIKSYFPQSKIKTFPSSPAFIEVHHDCTQFLVPIEADTQFKVGRWNNSPKTF